MVSLQLDGYGNMEADTFIALARAHTGLENFFSESFREGLEIFATGLASCPSLTVQGRSILEQSVVISLSNRLLVDDYLAARPELARAPIIAPIFVIGLPRSGTTLTNNLLSLDPDHRSLLNWEVDCCVPPAARHHLRTDPRCLSKKAAQQRKLREDPKVRPRWEDADGPTECGAILQQDFKSPSLESCPPNLRYSEFFLHADLNSAYRHHRRVLQVLQAEESGTWNLKLPGHALHLDALLSVYPDARLIWTHRDPVVATASLCSLIAFVHRWLMNQADTDFIAKNYPSQLYHQVQRPSQLRDLKPDVRIYDLHYSRLMRNPIFEMSRLYEWLGKPLTTQIEHRMRNWLTQNPQGKYGKHHYTLEQYGLVAEDLRSLFASYVGRYGVDREIS